MQRLGIALLFFALALSGNARSAQASYIFQFTSSPGSWIGQGQTIAIDTVSVARQYSGGGLYDGVSLYAGGYEFTLIGPNHALPTVGFYDNVTRWPPAGNGAAMAFVSPNRGDNVVTGWFNVLQADYASDGSVVDFAVDFKQYDEGVAADWSQGQIRYNSAVPVPEPATAGLALLGAALLLPRRRR